MGKKSFTATPSMSFISQESIEAVDGKPEPTTPTGNKKKAPEGYKVNPEFIEKRTKRVQLLVQPSLYSEAKTICNGLGISFNDFLHRALQEATYNDYVRGLIEKDVTEEQER